MRILLNVRIPHQPFNGLFTYTLHGPKVPLKLEAVKIRSIILQRDLKTARSSNGVNYVFAGFFFGAAAAAVAFVSTASASINSSSTIGAASPRLAPSFVIRQ